MCAETYSNQWKTEYSKHFDQIFIRLDIYLYKYVGLFSRVGNQEQAHL